MGGAEAYHHGLHRHERLQDVPRRTLCATVVHLSLRRDDCRPLVAGPLAAVCPKAACDAAGFQF